MQTIRNGEVWFSSLEEALADARSRLEPRPSGGASHHGLALALAGLHAGAFVVLGWAVLQQLARR